MTLRDQLTGPAPKRCRFAQVVAELPDDDRAAVVEYVVNIIEARKTNLRSPDYSASDLCRVLAANGHPVSINVIRSHISGSCICGKTS